jgi:pyruvate,orthophosphate dikinase
MANDSLTPQKILEFILKGGIEEAEPSLEAVLSSDSKLLTEAQVLTPGTARGTLLPFDKASRPPAPPRAILFCKSCAEVDLSTVDAVDGIITLLGDATSHIVLRARSLGKPVIRVNQKEANVLQSLPTGSVISVIAGQGKAGVFAGEVALRRNVNLTLLGQMATATKDYRTVKIRANIDDHFDASRAHALGADGIGMWRTENFLLRGKQSTLLRLLVSNVLSGQPSAVDEGLEELTEAMKSELLLILRESRGAPVVVRLLDLPLAKITGDNVNKTPFQSGRLHDSTFKSPLLSIRGARLGIVYPAIASFQLRAVYRAMRKAIRDGISRDLQVLIPFVTHALEIKWYRNLFRQICSTSGTDVNTSVKFGANIETPRAAITAGSIAELSDFFSFGTNDLTQYAWALDRNFGAAEIIDSYMRSNILSENPFANFDYAGVGSLMEHAIEKGRQSNARLIFGVTGNFGSDIRLVDYFNKLGIRYVSVPVAMIPIVALAYSKESLISAQIS